MAKFGKGRALRGGKKPGAEQLDIQEKRILLEAEKREYQRRANRRRYSRR